MNQTNEGILKDLEAAIENAALELDSKPVATRSGFGMLKSEAILAIPRLRNEYKERLYSNVVFFFTRGDKEKAAVFAAIAKDELGVFAVDADEVYNRLANRIEPTLGGRREFTVNQFQILNDEIEKITKDAPGNLTVPTHFMDSLIASPTQDDLVDYIRAFVTRAQGTALVDFYTSERVVDQALAAKFTGRVTAIVVTNATGPVDVSQALTKSARTSRVSFVDLDTAEAIDRAFAINVFKEAQKASKRTNK